jgi:hypothetical protein
MSALFPGPDHQLDLDGVCPAPPQSGLKRGFECPSDFCRVQSSVPRIDLSRHPDLECARPANGTLREDFLGREAFGHVLEAKVLVEAYRQGYAASQAVGSALTPTPD